MQLRLTCSRGRSTKRIPHYHIRFIAKIILFTAFKIYRIVQPWSVQLPNDYIMANGVSWPARAAWILVDQIKVFDAITLLSEYDSSVLGLYFRTMQYLLHRHVPMRYWRLFKFKSTYTRYDPDIIHYFIAAPIISTLYWRSFYYDTHLSSSK